MSKSQQLVFFLDMQLFLKVQYMIRLSTIQYWRGT